MRMKPKITHIGSRPKNPYLAHMLLRYVGKQSVPCQSPAHKEAADNAAQWEARWYEDMDRTLELVNQNVHPDLIVEMVYKETCREQDTRGIINHKTLLICPACADFIANAHIDDVEWVIGCLLHAHMNRRAILLVTNRTTLVPSVVGNIPLTTDEKEILLLLREGQQIGNLAGFAK